MIFDNLFKIEENWVIFYDMFSKNGNGDSIRPLAEEIRKRYPDMKFFFCTKSKKKYRLKHIDMADEILVKDSLRFKYVCSKAKYIITSMGYPNKGKKRNGQVFVATWHGSPLKRTFLALNKTNKKYIKYAKQFENTDIFPLQGEEHREFMKETFDLKDSMLICSGFPRNDILFNHDESFKSELKQKLGLPQDKKVILYMPTWRKFDYKAILPLDLKLMKEKLSKDYVLLMRSHMGKHKWVDENNHPIEIFDNEFVFDGGSYPESTHLYLITDIFISDYSSAVYDFAVTKKPEILYIYDEEEYCKKFGLFYKMSDFSPFPKARNSEELINAVLNLNIDEKEYQDFIDKFANYEKGNAAEQIVDKMLNYSVEDTKI